MLPLPQGRIKQLGAYLVERFAWSHDRVLGIVVFVTDPRGAAALKPSRKNGG